MTRLTTAILLTTLVSTSLWVAPSFAQMGGANTGNGEAPRGAPLDIDIGKAKPVSPPKVDSDTRAAPMMDEGTAVKSFSVLTKNSDGSQTRSDPSDALKAIVIQSLRGKSGKKADATPAPQSGTDPALTEGEEADRQVFGPDDRVQIKNTKVYPYTTIGYIQGKTKDGYASCSGTLIGPKTVLTAGHCLYNNEEKGWLEEVVYIPSLNGSTAEDAPFGAYKFDKLNVVEGFVTNYNVSYDSVLPWDLGIITLAEPVGDSLGWLSVYNYEDLSDFDANIVGYPGDKPGGTMWRSACRVLAEAISEDIFTYDCDTFPGSSGSAVYVYDKGAKQRVVTGVNVAESATENLAVRLNATYIEWISSIWK